MFGQTVHDLQDKDMWLGPLNCIFLAVAWFFHSYSFPTGASNLQKFSNTRGSESDVYLTRKHAALVSIFLVDLPNLFVRMYVWVNYPLYPGLQPFLFKNIVNIPLSTFRLNQCRAAEKTLNASKVIRSKCSPVSGSSGPGKYSQDDPRERGSDFGKVRESSKCWGKSWTIDK